MVCSEVNDEQSSGSPEGFGQIRDAHAGLTSAQIVDVDMLFVPLG